jgi:hypothetical protein
MHDHWGAIRDPIMQLRQSNTLEKIEWAGDEVGSEVPTQPASGYPSDFLSPNRDVVLALLKPDGGRKRTIWLVAGAMVAGFGVGWAGGFSWYGSANMAALNPITQTETPAHRAAEKRLGGKIEGARKTTSTLGVRTPPPGATQISAAGASISAKPLATGSDGAQLSVEQAAMTPTGSIAQKGPPMPASEPGPTTIEGWRVLDVRGGTAVLGGPDGVRMASAATPCPALGVSSSSTIPMLKPS